MPTALSKSELAPLLSPYLSTGFKNESVTLHSVELDGGDHFAGDFELENGTVDMLGRYHLSSLTATLMLSQLSVVAAHIDQGMERRKGELFVHDLSLRFRRQVNSPLVRCELTVARRRPTSSGFYYKMSASVANGAFVGGFSVLLMDA